jgi:hypothetical protein
MLDKTDDIALAARDWLAAFEAALTTQDAALDRLFIPTAIGATCWR